MPKEFLAKNYLNRNDLETAIRIDAGTDIETNRSAGNIIKGTREELKKLHLTDETSVFGCKCVITDEPTSKILEEKIKKPK